MTITKSVNPLSDARRAQLKGRPKKERPKDTENVEVEKASKKRDRSNFESFHSNNTKAEQKAKELWHKKSGAGFSLFVDYYGGQPLGTVTADNGCGTATAGEVKISKDLQIQGRGQSRAAKKRRKKKKNVIHVDKNDLHEAKLITTSSVVEEELSSDLSQALRDTKQAHLKVFLAAISKPLPLTFRLRRPLFLNFLTIQSLSDEMVTNITENHGKLIQPVSYDPEKNIFQALPGTTLTKFTLGKRSKELKELIVNGSISGVLARQELGSMLPILALSGGGYIKFGSKVLDMCASPGSKTLQALEIVAGSHFKIESPQCKVKRGRVVANDIHPMRLESLKEAMTRSGVPEQLLKRIVYTNHDASSFPAPKSGSKFDCIVADVPCSGDGTVRKDSHILPGWMPSIGNSLHDIQKRILKRALRLLKVGGVCAYSTCSLNPVEDEAVVSSCLTWANQGVSDGTCKVELLDWPAKTVPNFIRRPGIQTWRVGDYDEEKRQTIEGKDTDTFPTMSWYDSYEEAEEHGMVHAKRSLWPYKANQQNLEKCSRLLPQGKHCVFYFMDCFLLRLFRFLYS